MKPDFSFADSNTASILNNLNTAVFRTNLEGTSNIIDVNPAFIKMFGFKDKSDLLSVPVLELYHNPEDRAALREELERHGKIRNREVLLKKKDGSIFPGLVSSVLVKDEKGDILFIDGVVDDISDLKAKETELLLERQVFLSGPVVLIQWPVKEEELLINISENVKDLLGYEASEFLDGDILYPDLVHEEDRPDLQEHIRAILAGDSDTLLVHPYRLRQKQGDYIWVQDYAYIQRDRSGKAVGILGYIYDVTAQQNSQREALENERRLRSLVENSPTGILKIDRHGNIIEVNQKMVDMLGSPSKEATQSFNIFTFKPLIDGGISEKFQQSISDNKIVSFDGQYLSNWGKDLHYKLIISPVLDAEGHVIGAQANMEDLTDTHLAEAAKLKIQNDQLEERRIFISSPIMIVKWGFSTNDPILYVSENVGNILGYTVDEFLSKDMTPNKFIHPDDIDQVRADTRAAIDKGLSGFESGPYRVKKKDGSYIWVSDYSSINWDVKGEPKAFSGILWDITHVVEAEREMEFLLREVHHRVKNNMQVIISLLNIQADYVGNDQLTEIFGETQNRIRSMSLVHDKLFRSKKLSSVDFGNYISSLITELQTFYNLESERIQIHQEIEDIKLDITKAIPCGLIVNELVTNAIKYAFPNNGEGDIWVSTSTKAGNVAEVKVRDNGVGLGKDVDFSEAQSMGLRIVRILTEQLDATIDIDSKDGTKFSLTLDLDE